MCLNQSNVYDNLSFSVLVMHNSYQVVNSLSIFKLKELVQGVTAISPLSARPIMTPQQVPFPKHQGITLLSLLNLIPEQALSSKLLIIFHAINHDCGRTGIGAGQALQLCVPPPFVAASGPQQQPFGMPCHVPVLQPPFPTNRPIQVPGPDGLFGSKFS